MATEGEGREGKGRDNTVLQTDSWHYYKQLVCTVRHTHAHYTPTNYKKTMVGYTGNNYDGIQLRNVY